MGELSGLAGDWLGWRRTIDSLLWGQAWGEGTVVLRRPRRRSQTLGGPELGRERGRGNRNQSLAETWSLRHRGDREQRACGDSWGGGGGERGHMPGGGEEAWGSGAAGAPPGCQEKTSGQPQSSCIGNWQGKLSPIEGCALTRVLCVVQWPCVAAPGSTLLKSHKA